MARHLLGAWLAVVLSVVCAAPALAVVPSEQLLPDTTAGYLSVPDVDALRERWKATELGKLIDDPIMKPFVDDLREQLDARLSKTGIKLGVTWDDLAKVYGGEVAIAAVQPDGKVANHALVLLVDVTGKRAEADALLAKVATEQKAKGAKVAAIKVEGIDVTDITLAKDVRGLADHAYYGISGDQLVVTDHLATLTGILRQIKAASPASLANVDAYKISSENLKTAAGEEKPHVRWFVDPFRYVEVRRAMTAAKRKRGTDMLKVLRNQGFAAVKSAAGYVTLSANEERDVVHRTFIYAPQDDKADKGQKYRLGARMLDFPNKTTEAPPAWVPSHTGTFLSLNWRMKDAFGKYLGSIVDEFAGDPIFEEVLQSIAEDPHGPMVDLRKDLIDHLGERVMVMSDAIEPIDTKSERLMFAFELADAAAVKATVDKAMAKEPDVRKIEHKGHIIWEIVSTTDEVAFHVEEIRIDGAGFDTVGAEVPVAAVADDGEEAAKLPNSAVTVANGHLIVASHVDFLTKALDEQETTLDKAKDFVRLNGELDKLGAGKVAARQFVRTDKAYHTTYELLRQNKMPEGETVLARALNRLLADEDADEPTVRKQEIDGKKMPEFSEIRKYFGPSGFFVTAEKDGWLITGCLLKNE